MRPAAVLLFLALASTASAEVPTYTAEEKLKMFRTLNVDAHAKDDRRVEWHVGYIEFHVLGMDWRFFYLPILAPLPGTRLQDNATVPNAFDLTRTPYASTFPPMLEEPDRPRAVQRERARIEASAKKSDPH
jgi:hypothetical protein